MTVATEVGSPSLRTSDDVDALAAPLAGLLRERGETLLGCRYRRWKPGTSLVVALDLASGPAWAYAAAAGPAKLDKTVDRAPAGSVLLDRRDLGLLVARPPADRDLPALADLEGALALAVPAGPGPRTWRGLAYKPQRRWVGVVDDDGVRRTVRACRREDLAAARAGLARAAGLAGTDVPRVEAVVPRLGLLVTSWLPGRALDGLLAGPEAGDLLVAAGAALAGVHAATRGAAGPADADDGLPAVAAQLVALLPGESARVRRVVSRLAACRVPDDVAVLRHGDFSADQVVVADDGRVGIVDWDRSAPGHAVDDLATADAAGLDPQQHAALLEGYGGVRAVPAGLPAAVARARFLRAAEPFRRCSPSWPAEVRGRLDAIEDLLGRHQPGDLA